MHHKERLCTSAPRALTAEVLPDSQCGSVQNGDVAADRVQDAARFHVPEDVHRQCHCWPEHVSESDSFHFQLAEALSGQF